MVKKIKKYIETLKATPAQRTVFFTILIFSLNKLLDSYTWLNVIIIKICHYLIIGSDFATKRDIKEIEQKGFIMEQGLKRDIKNLEIAMGQELKQSIKESERRLTIKLGGLLLIALIAMSTLSNLGII